MESVDPFSALRGGLARVARRDEEWAGIPMPLQGQRLIIEPSYPNAKALSLIGLGLKPEDQEEPAPASGQKVRNQFWSCSLRSMVVIIEENGRITFGILPEIHHFKHDMETLRSSEAWSIECESNALQTLGTLLGHRGFKQYLLTGSFIETSKRSGTTYMFRKLRPTVAISTKGPEPRILCTLCLHPIGYYEGSWAGSMTPTDDVIAHLMLMRGDEKMFWRRANQTAPHRAAAGL